MKIGILTRLPRYYTEERLKEEALKRGHEVLMIRYPACHIEISSETPAVIYEGQSIDDLSAVIPRIYYAGSSYGAAILRQFEVMGTYTTAKSQAIGRSYDVLRCLQILNRAGVGIPKTIATREPSQLDNLIERVGLPAVLKVASPTRNNSVVMVETKKAASSVLQAFYMNDANILIQEYAKKQSTDEIHDVRAVVVGSSVVASVRKDSGSSGFFSNPSKDEYAHVARLSEGDQKLAIKAAKAIGLSVCVVDMILSPHGKYVLRLDPSFGLENIEAVTGRNVAGKIIEYIELNAKRRNKKDKIGA